MIARADIRPYRYVVRGLHARGWMSVLFLHHNPRNSPNSYLCSLRIIALSVAKLKQVCRHEYCLVRVHTLLVRVRT